MSCEVINPTAALPGLGAELSHMHTTEGQHSDRVPVTPGVRQGSVIGPCLSRHYINDLPEGIGSTVRLFADDTVMYLTIASQTDSHKLQTDLNNLAKWEKSWQMQFHPDKCQVLRITNKRNPIIFNYTLHDHILVTVTQAKYLARALIGGGRGDASPPPLFSLVGTT